MQKRYALLGGAALGVLCAGAIGATAQAAPKHHHPAAAASVDTVTQEKIESLTAAVSTLESRLNDETAARQADEARAQAAEAKADSAEADAQAVRGEMQAQIQTIPTDVQSAVAAVKPKPSWTDGTKIGATVFTDLSNINQTPTPNKINGTGVDIKRAYLIVDHQFSPIYSANLTIDFAPNGIILNGGAFGTGTLMGSEAIKYAYVQAKYADELVIQGGAEKTPWIPFVEDLYGYRYIDKVMIDQNKFGNSSDWGVNAHGDLGKGLFDYSISVEDGAGYKNPTRSQQMDFEARGNFNWNGFVLAGGGYWGKLANDIQTAPPTLPPAPQTATRYDVLVAYVNPKFRIGAEYFNATDWKVVPKITPDQAQGWSVWGAYNFTPQWAVFGRYDGLDPSMKLDAPERYNFWDVGIQYEPVKTVDISLVYKNENISHAIKGGYTDGTTTLAPNSTGAYNPVTGVFTGTLTSGNYSEVGIYTQFKF
jgi:hypothetical protein